VRRDGLRTEVANSLREAIFNQSLRPGDQLREIELAAKIGVSRGPLREALLILEKEGLIEIRPNRGAFIRKMTNEEMAEIFTLRVPLETLALMRAKERMTEEMLERLRACFADMRALAKSGGIRRLVEVEFEFHKLIWAASGHALLNETLIRICTPWFAFAEVHYSPSKLDFSADVESHRPLLDYLAGATELSATECQRRHFSVTREPQNEFLKAALEAVFTGQGELFR
jgi:DNA-binding GntR family transcriptional regulator